MAQSQMQMDAPVGELAQMAMAATPGGLGKHGLAPAPPGTSPSAKKPLDRSTFEKKQQGIPKQLTADEMSAGFNNLASLQSRDEQYVQSIARCVQFNAMILNDLTSKVNGMEVEVLGHKDKLGKQQFTMDTMKATVEGAIDLVNGLDINRDNLLRAELNAMAEKLDAEHAALKIKMEKIENSGLQPPPGIMPGIQPGIAPDIDRVAGMVRQLQNKVDLMEPMVTKFPVLEEFIKQSSGKFQDIELKQNFATANLQEVQGAMTAVRVEMQQVVQQINSGAAAAAASVNAAAAAAGIAAAPGMSSSAPTFDPWASAAFGSQPQQQQQQAQQQQQQQQQRQPSTYYVGSPGGNDCDEKPTGSWKLYDEKYIMPPALTLNKYCPKSPMEWLQGIKDYVAGRCEELDALLNWAEAQKDPIEVELIGASDCCPMLNKAPSLREVSRQLWAMLNPLVRDSKVADMFANVPRHNGLEAWRQLSEPVIEDKELLQKDLLPSVTNPKGASTMEGIEQAVLDWDTNIRLFKKAGGIEPSDYHKRITFIRMLPVEVGVYVSMHWEMEAYNTYGKLKAFVFKYVKTIRNLRRPTARAAHLVELPAGHDEQPPLESEIDEEHEELLQRLATTEDAEEKIEILAVMSRRGFRPPTRGQGGQRRTTGGRVAGAYLPPRGAKDLGTRTQSCINCGSKTHSTKDCREAEKPKSERPCFGCGKTGHISKDCPLKKRAPLKAITDAPVAERPKASVFAIGIAPRRQPSTACVSDFMIAKGKKQNNNRYQPLTSIDDIASKSPSGRPSELTSELTPTNASALCSHKLSKCRSGPLELAAAAGANGYIDFPVLPGGDVVANGACVGAPGACVGAPKNIAVKSDTSSAVVGSPALKRWTDIVTIPYMPVNTSVHTAHMTTRMPTDTSHIPSPHTSPVSFAPSPYIVPIPDRSTPIATSTPAPIAGRVSPLTADAQATAAHACIDNSNMGHMGHTSRGGDGGDRAVVNVRDLGHVRSEVERIELGSARRGRSPTVKGRRGQESVHTLPSVDLVSQLSFSRVVESSNGQLTTDVDANVDAHKIVDSDWWLDQVIDDRPWSEQMAEQVQGCVKCHANCVFHRSHVFESHSDIDHSKGISRNEASTSKPISIDSVSCVDSCNVLLEDVVCCKSLALSYATATATTAAGAATDLDSVCAPVYFCGSPSPFSKELGQDIPVLNPPNRLRDPSSGTRMQLAGAEETECGEAKGPCKLGAEGPIRNRSCCTHVLDFPTCALPTCDCIVDATLDRAGLPTHFSGSACATQVVYNIPLEGDMEAIANRRVIHIAPTSSPSSRSSSTAEASFDSLLREQWQSHVRSLGKLGASKGWGGNYWKTWYAEVKLGCDAVVAVESSKASGGQAVKSDSSSANGCAARELLEGDEGHASEGMLKASVTTRDSCDGSLMPTQVTPPTTSPVACSRSSGSASPCGVDMCDAGQATPIPGEERGEPRSCIAFDAPGVVGQVDDNGGRAPRGTLLEPEATFGDAEVDRHNAQVSKLLHCLGSSGSGRRAVIDAIARLQGIEDADELERLYDGSSAAKLCVPLPLRETMMDIGLGNLLAPISLVTVTGTAEILANTDAWKDLEFEVALDSGSVVHVCSVEDIGGYRVADSPGSRAGQEFQMGDGGTIPNLGQSQLNLSDESIGRDIQSVFQVAAVTRPLMSVGRICDEGHSVTFNSVMAVVNGKDGSELCRFVRNGSGLYVAKLKLRSPAGFGGQE